MPHTRTTAAKQREKKRLQKREERARYSPSKKLAINKARRLSAQIRRETIIAAQAKLEKNVRTARAQVKRILETNQALQEQVQKRLKDEAQDEEPILDDVDVKNIEAAYAFARSSPRDFELLTGETLQSFDDLFKLAADALRARTWRGDERQRAAAAPPRVSDELQLFICLLFLRQYPTYTMLRFSLRALDDLTLSKYIHRVLRALESLKELKIKWPSEKEFAELLKKQEKWPFARLRKVVCAVDGTEIKVPRPSKGAMKNPHYSAKKKQYSLNVLVIVRMDGVIIYCSKPTAKLQDQALWNDLNLRERFVGKPYGIMGDGGFTFNCKTKSRSEPHIIGVTPHKRRRTAKGSKEKAKLTLKQLRQNIELSKSRVVVENTNYRLKRYKVIGSKLRHYRPASAGQLEKGITPELIMNVVAGLTNRSILRDPLRSSNWVPEKVTKEDVLAAAKRNKDGEEEDVVNKDK